MLAGKLRLDFSVIVNLALLSIYKQYLSGLKTSLFGYLCRLEVHHAHLTGYNHHVVLGYRVARRTQTVTVEHTSGVAAVAEQQCGRTVPRFHKYRMILVESPQILGNRVLVVETLGHHYGHGVGQ